MAKAALWLRVTMLVVSTLLLALIYPDCLNLPRTCCLWFVWLCSAIPHRWLLKSHIACISIWVLSLANMGWFAYWYLQREQYVGAIIGPIIVAFPAASLAISVLANKRQSPLLADEADAPTKSPVRH